MCTRLFGVPFLLHTLRGLEQAGCVDHVVIALPPHQGPALPSALASILATVDDMWVQTCTGSADWMESARSACAASNATDGDVLLVHEPTRPWTQSDTTRAIVDTVRAGALAAVPVVPVTDTIKEIDSRDRVAATLDRARFRTAQSPWGFRTDVLNRISSCGQLDRLDPPVQTIAGHRYGMRVSTAFDLAVLEALITSEGAS